eukprot:g43473.t1
MVNTVSTMEVKNPHKWLFCSRIDGPAAFQDEAQEVGSQIQILTVGQSSNDGEVDTDTAASVQQTIKQDLRVTMQKKEIVGLEDAVIGALEVMKNVDEGRVMRVVYMDFSKALDKVPNGRLIQKTKMHGIRNKCEVLHFGRSNVKEKYTVNGRTLNSINAQKDLGVHVHSSLKVAMQVDRVVKKAYGMLAFIGYVKLLTISRVRLLMLMEGGVDASWPIMLVFLTLIVSPNSLQAWEKQSTSCDYKVERQYGITAKSNSENRTLHFGIGVQSYPIEHCHQLWHAGISSSMNFDEEEDEEDEDSSSSSQLNSNTRPGSASSKKSNK